MTEFEKLLLQPKVPSRLTKLVSYVLRKYRHPGALAIRTDTLEGFMLKLWPAFQWHEYANFPNWACMEDFGAACASFWQEMDNLLKRIYKHEISSIDESDALFTEICQKYPQYEDFFAEAGINCEIH